MSRYWQVTLWCHIHVKVTIFKFPEVVFYKDLIKETEYLNVCTDTDHGVATFSARSSLLSPDTGDSGKMVISVWCLMQNFNRQVGSNSVLLQSIAVPHCCRQYIQYKVFCCDGNGVVKNQEYNRPYWPNKAPDKQAMNYVVSTPKKNGVWSSVRYVKWIEIIVPWIYV